MIKHWYKVVIPLVIAGGFFAFFRYHKTEVIQPLSTKAPSQNIQSFRTPASIPTTTTTATHTSRAMVNPQHWQDELEENLREQGGANLKDVAIVKERTIQWRDRGQVILAQAVKISITNQKNEETKFRALVDADTGKIIHTWDQPIFDAINPRENFGIKLDPRYNP